MSLTLIYEAYAGRLHRCGFGLSYRLIAISVIAKKSSLTFLELKDSELKRYWILPYYNTIALRGCNSQYCRGISGAVLLILHAE